MKSSFLLFLMLAVAISCSKDDENDEFHPPQWLIGTWDHENSEATLQTYIVSANNVILEYPDGSQLDYGTRAAQNNGYYIREEIISDSEYKYELVDNGDTGQEPDIVTFQKISNQRLKLIISLQQTNGSIYNKR
ncbi:MAG: hypothetical protein AAFP76_03605 [Bacteroidota bacterium]